MNESLINAYKKFKITKQYDNCLSCLVELYKEDVKGTYELIKDLRSAITQSMKKCSQQEAETWFEITHKTYQICGLDYFDDFMIAVEWHREPEKRFWLPRRKQLMPICIELQKLEDNGLDELFISQPPRTGKSTITQFFLLWVMARNSERSNLYCSYADGVADAFYSGVLEMLSDTATYSWTEVFPGHTVANTDSKLHTLNLDRRKKYSSFTARSIDGQLNGSCDCSGYLLIDDVNDGIAEALNDERLKSTWTKIENNLLSRAKQTAKILWIGTRWSVKDAIAKRIELLSNDKHFKNRRFKVINVPALNEKDESNFDYLYELGFSSETYKARRASFERSGDLASWNAQYQGKPVERTGTVFLPDELRYFNGVLPIDIEPDGKYIFCDPAWGGGDYVSAPILYRYGEDIYIPDVTFRNEDKLVTEPCVASKIVNWQVLSGVVEGTRVTRTYGDDINRLLKEKDYRCNLVVNTNNLSRDGKAQRILNAAPDIRLHMIFLQSGCRSKEYEAFMQCLFSFSYDNNQQHDDAPDSLAGALTMITHPVDRNAKIVRIYGRI